MFEKGVSGNPRGRPFMPKGLADLRRLIAKDARTVIQKLLDLALEGDVQAAKLLIERTIPVYKPTEYPVAIDLNPTDDLTTQGRAVVAGLTDGTLAPGQAGQLLQGLGALARLIEVDQLEKRIAALESKQ